MDDDGTPGVGVGDGVGDGEAGDDEESPPQAVANSKIADRAVRRNDNIRSSEPEASETSGP
jgi:hypothetical protein